METNATFPVEDAESDAFEAKVSPVVYQKQFFVNLQSSPRKNVFYLAMFEDSLFFYF